MKIKFLIALIITFLYTSSAAAFSNTKVNARNFESLHASLQAILKPLSQAERLEFMEAFFDYAKYSECKQKGTIRGYTVKPPKTCESHIGWSKQRAIKYISDGRMDNKGQYATHGIFGGANHGHSAKQSYVIFINIHGERVDGKSANFILNKMRSLKGIAQHQRDQSAADSKYHPICRAPEKFTNKARHISALKKMCEVSNNDLVSLFGGLRKNANSEELKGLQNSLRGFDGKYILDVRAAKEKLGSNYAAVTTPSPNSPSTSSDLKVDAKLLEALRLVSLDKTDQFRAKASGRVTKISFQPTLTIASPNEAEIKYVSFGVALVPRSNPQDMFSVIGLVNMLTPLGGGKYQSKSNPLYKVIRNEEANHAGKAQNDFVLLPFVRKINFADGTSKTLVDDPEDMLYYLRSLDPET